jgi:hypothetical protein
VVFQCKGLKIQRENIWWPLHGFITKGKKYEKKHLVTIGKSKYEVQNDGHQVKRMLKV